MLKSLAVLCLLAFSLILGGCGGGSTAQMSSGSGGGSGNGSGGGGGSNNSACSGMTAAQGGSLNGFRPFTASNLWNTDISSAPVDANSNALIGFIGTSVGLHPDFGSGQYAGSNIGIPYVVVDSTQSPVTVNFTAYGSESDPGPMPVPANAPIEGDPNPSGDRHVLVLDNSSCFLYELYNSYPNSDGTWNAD